MAESKHKKLGRASVAIAKLKNYDTSQPRVDMAVQEVVDILGGIKHFVQPGQIVALKPNQTLWKLSTSGSTTSPSVLISLIKMCRGQAFGLDWQNIKMAREAEPGNCRWWAWREN